MVGRVANEGDALAALVEQVGGDVETALEFVAADRDAGLVGNGRAPADETGALFNQPLQPLARLVVVGHSRAG